MLAMTASIANLFGSGYPGRVFANFTVNSAACHSKCNTCTAQILSLIFEVI